MRVTYHGPFEAVVIGETGQTVKNGETVEVPAPVGRALAEQDSWTVTTAKKPDPTPDAGDAG